MVLKLGQIHEHFSPFSLFFLAADVILFNEAVIVSGHSYRPHPTTQSSLIRMDQQLLEPIAKLGDRIVRVVSNVPVLMNCLLQAERSTGLDRRNIALIVSTIAVVIVLSSSITT